MSALRAARLSSRAAAVILIAAGATACGLLPAPTPGAARILALPTARSSVLGIVIDQNSPTARQLTSSLLGDSPRAGEHIFVLNDCGSLLVSSVAPTQPRQQAPVPPAPLPASPTTFQKARYQQAERAYQAKLDELAVNVKALAGIPAFPTELTATGTIQLSPAAAAS